MRVKRSRDANGDALTDPNGSLLGVVVTQASVQDLDGAKPLLCMLCHSFLEMLIILSNCGYAGKLEAIVQSKGRPFGD